MKKNNNYVNNNSGTDAVVHPFCATSKKDLNLTYQNCENLLTNPDTVIIPWDEYENETWSCKTDVIYCADFMLVRKVEADAYRIITYYGMTEIDEEIVWEIIRRKIRNNKT